MNENEWFLTFSLWSHKAPSASKFLQRYEWKLLQAYLTTFQILVISIEFSFKIWNIFVVKRMWWYVICGCMTCYRDIIFSDQYYRISSSKMWMWMWCASYTTISIFEFPVDVLFIQGPCIDSKHWICLPNIDDNLPCMRGCTKVCIENYLHSCLVSSASILKIKTSTPTVFNISEWKQWMQ